MCYAAARVSPLLRAGTPRPRLPVCAAMLALLKGRGGAALLLWCDTRCTSMAMDRCKGSVHALLARYDVAAQQRSHPFAHMQGASHAAPFARDSGSNT